MTVVRRVPEVVLVRPERLIAASGGDLERPVRILEDGGIRELPVRLALERQARARRPRIPVLTEVRHLEQTTVGALLTEAGEDQDRLLEIVTGTGRPRVATIGELLAGMVEIPENALFYVHSVTAADRQGVWGIIHDSLIRNFARGVALREGKTVNTYRVHIPRDADERLPDRSSSWLGRMIDRKTRESVVYNFTLGRMSRDPDLILPGDEIVIVTFTPQELVDIYKHFARSAGEEVRRGGARADG